MGASSYNNDRRQEGGYEGSSNSNRNSPPSSQSDVPPSIPLEAPASHSPASSSTPYASAETAGQPYYKSSSFFDETVSLSPTSSYGAGSSDPNEPAAFAGRFIPSALAPASPSGGESYESEASNHQATPVFNGPSQYNSATEPRNNEGSQSNYGEAPQGYSGNFQQQPTGGEGDYGGQGGNSYSSDASSSSGNHQSNEGGDGYGSGPSTSVLAQQAANQVSLSISKYYRNRYAQHQTL